MDVRRLLSPAKAFIIERHDQPADVIEGWLAEKFEHEMTDDERRRARYANKLRELGMTDGTSALMDAFALPQAGG
jgi:hypothetical protein